MKVSKVTLYKHGVGHFEREGTVDGDAALSLTFRQAEVSDVLKSLTVLDLDGGHVASVSYDSTKPLAQLLADVALSIPDDGSLVGLLPQIKGARVAVDDAGTRAEGTLLGIDRTQRRSADGVLDVVLVSLLTDGGAVRQFDLHGLGGLEVLDASLRRDLDYYLRTQLSAKKKDARTFTFFAEGQGARRVRLSYTLEAPVWKATYRVLLPTGEGTPLIQGWAVVDNTQDEDWEGVELSLVAGLPVSFTHDLYTPRYLRRPEVAVRETTGVLPPEVEAGMEVESVDSMLAELTCTEFDGAKAAPQAARSMAKVARAADIAPEQLSRAQVRERKVGDLFEYQIEHPVTIRRNQSALVPIVLRPFDGRTVLLHNRRTRAENPMRAVELHNTTGLTLEGGPVTVLEGTSYVGEAMLDTLEPDGRRLVPYAVELSVRVLDDAQAHAEEAHRLIIRDGRLEAQSRLFWTTTYHLDNRSEREYVCYLDHPREAGRTLVDPREPAETTENSWRFRFALAPRQVTRFAVRQEQLTRQVQFLGGLDADALQAVIDQKALDAPTREALRQAAAAQRRAAEAERRMGRLDGERDRIHREQGRIRENLQALGDKGDERALRGRLVKALTDQEDRLEAIAAEHAQEGGQREAARAEFAERVARLAFDGGR